MTDQWKDRKFGIELEYTGVSRAESEKLMRQSPFGEIIGGKIVRDASIRTLIPRGLEDVNPDDYRVEYVSPILFHEDFICLTPFLNNLRRSGAKPSASCGCHIHINIDDFTAVDLRRLNNLYAAQECNILSCFHPNASRKNFCKDVDVGYLNAINKPGMTSNLTMEKVRRIWYDSHPDKDSSESDRYHNSRYHALNIHSFFQGRGIEFRLFNSSLYAQELKAYTEFVLRLVQHAKDVTAVRVRGRRTEGDLQHFSRFLHEGLDISKESSFWTWRILTADFSPVSVRPF